MLNSNSPIPLYHQLAEIIKNKIMTGQYKAGSTIPSEIELKNRYKIGRPTVRQALDVLVKNDLVFRKRGSGTFVKEKPKEVDLFSLAGTSLAFQTRGISIKTRIVEEIALIDVQKDKENPFYNDKAFYLSRQTSAENKPVLLENIYFHSKLFAGIDKIDLRGQSLARVVLDNFYLKPENGRQTFKISKLCKKDAKMLGLKENEQILELRRTLNFPDAEKAVYSRLLCKTDDFAFSQIISGNGKQ